MEIAHLLAESADETIRMHNSSICWRNLFIDFIDELVAQAIEWEEKYADFGEDYAREVACAFLCDTLSYLARKEQAGSLTGVAREDRVILRKKLEEWKKKLPYLPVWK